MKYKPSLLENSREGESEHALRENKDSRQLSLDVSVQNPSNNLARKDALEPVIKDYLLNHEKVLQQDLITHFRVGYKTITDCLENAGICLMPKKWHTENCVLREYKSGYCPEEIGKRLNRSTGYVCDILTKFGKDYKTKFKKDPTSPFTEKVVLESYERGNHTIAQLATDLGITWSRACGLKRKFNLPSARRGRKKKDYSNRNNLLEQGYLQTEVARIEGVGRAAIYDHLERNPDLKTIWEKARMKRDFPNRRILLEQGYTQTEVARIEGVCIANISQYLKRRPEIKSLWEKARDKRLKS